MFKKILKNCNYNNNSVYMENQGSLEEEESFVSNDERQKMHRMRENIEEEKIEYNLSGVIIITKFLYLSCVRDEQGTLSKVKLWLYKR